MKLRKISAIAALTLSAGLFLGACGSDDSASGDKVKKDEAKVENTTTNKEETTKKLLAGAPLQDGTYTLSEKELDKNGWKVNFSITVKDGKITESNYDYVNADGAKKSEDENYQKMMSDKTGVGPKEFVPALNNALIEKQDASQVEVVTGATHSAESFINYAQQLIQAAQKGDTTPIEIDAQAALKDGEYKLAEKNIGSTGWKTYINMTVKDGKISEVDYNYVNAEGQLKTDDEDYQKTMTEKSGVGPQDFVPALSNDLVEKQSAGDVAVVTGATHSSHSFKMYAAQLINAAQKGNTTPIEVDNFVFEK
ncbi:extracellular electron transfer flavoprotein PplA [Bacillus kwashiorkori]|uniref:extracellular electron transfer flavoprotein PplA n=1 Tax=Bacillus kwashiorkori TaxID=1522318 RepID=UPI000781ABF5|nr:extracellular electron transfer flavoprotein PplA [Bacillus kwashiorkori]